MLVDICYYYLVIFVFRRNTEKFLFKCYFNNDMLLTPSLTASQTHINAKNIFTITTMLPVAMQPIFWQRYKQ